MALRRAKFRGVVWIREQALMTAPVQHIMRMVNLLSKEDREVAAIANPTFVEARHH
jgi:hypothetical protein